MHYYCSAGRRAADRLDLWTFGQGNKQAKSKGNKVHRQIKPCSGTTVPGQLAGQTRPGRAAGQTGSKRRVCTRRPNSQSNATRKGPYGVPTGRAAGQTSRELTTVGQPGRADGQGWAVRARPGQGGAQSGPGPGDLDSRTDSRQTDNITGSTDLPRPYRGEKMAWILFFCPRLQRAPGPVYFLA
ncbi:unnamed protein product [Calypogeia fissa]